jgi:hypothetical protein
MTKDDHETKFREFHEANPHVYLRLVEMTRAAKGKGHRKFGVRVLWEALRWERMMSTSDPTQDDWKLNDHYTRFYSRLIMKKEPDLAGIFEIRGEDAAAFANVGSQPPSWRKPLPKNGYYDQFDE